MAKQAHITSHPNVGVGEKHLALCGKEFKVKVTWDDVPKDKPICRDCVDMALLAMTEADLAIEAARKYLRLLMQDAEAVSECLHPDDFPLDVIADFTSDFEERQSAKREAKELKQKERTTCTCTWETEKALTGEARIHQRDENCPIHGHSSGGTGHDVEEVTEG